MFNKTEFVDGRKINTRDVLLLILRKPYNENFTIITKLHDASKLVGRLRTALTRVKAKVKDQGKSAKPITITVVSIETKEDRDLLILCKQSTRSSLGDPLGDLVKELGENTVAQG